MRKGVKLRTPGIDMYIYIETFLRNDQQKGTAVFSLKSHA